LIAPSLGLGFTSLRLLAAPALASSPLCAALPPLADGAARTGFQPVPTGSAGGSLGRGGSSSAATTPAARGCPPGGAAGQATTLLTIASQPAGAAALAAEFRPATEPARSPLSAALLALAAFALLAVAGLGLLIATGIYGSGVLS
jgi:hypothetical protein